jgi:hypothetical protein
MIPMRKTQLFGVLAVLVMSACATSLAQTVSENSESADAAAAQGLAILRTMANDNKRELGFASGSEAARAKLGTPLAVYSVELAALAAFKPGGDAAALLKTVPAMFYPVLLDGSVRSAVRVEKGDAGWHAARVGNAGLATSVARARGALPKPDDPDTALVQVLALNLVFVGQKGADGWLLSPVIDDRSVSLKVGSVERAAEVMVRLAPIAAQHNGEPT